MNRKIQTSLVERSNIAAALAISLLVGFPGLVIAAAVSAAKTVDIRTWHLDPATGWSVRALIGKNVKSPTGQDVGEVDNIIFGPDGRVRKLIVSTGGFLELNEKNLAVKWSDVKLAASYQYVTTPITAESVEKYGLFDNSPKSSGPLAPREWRASELIGNYVYLKGNVPYAYVRDLIVAQDGQLQAVIVSPAAGNPHGVGGYFAFPFFDTHHSWHPGDAHYDLPYDKADIADLVPYKYPRPEPHFSPVPG